MLIREWPWIAAGTLLLIGCARPPASAARQQREAAAPPAVARHVMVLVTEDVGKDEKRDSIVIAEPLGDVPRNQTAFVVTNAAYHVGFAWDSAPALGRCLMINVTRSGDPLGPDFKASGCVPIDGPAATVASLESADGRAIEVAAWFFDTTDAPPDSEAPRSSKIPPPMTADGITPRFHGGGNL